MIVVDANTVAYFLVPGPLQPAAQAVMERDAAWVAPPLWRSELRNTLVASVWQRKLTPDQALDAYDLATGLVRDVDLPDATTVMQMALLSRCTAYDCEYVLTARMLGCKLATADKQVLRAFPGDTVAIKGRRPGEP